MRAAFDAPPTFGAMKVPPDFSRVPQGPTIFHNISRHVLRVVRPSSEKPSDQKIAVLMGGTLRKTEVNGFRHTFTVLSLAHLLRQHGLKCWLGGKSDHAAAGLTVQQSTCLALLSITWWALGSKNSTRLRGLWGKVSKMLLEVSTTFCKSYGAALRKGSNQVSR